MLFNISGNSSIAIMSSETLQPLLTHPPKAYKQRWYILSVFSLVSVLQNAIWNTWGPIDHAVNIVFGWEDDRIALFANLGSMVYVVAFFPAIYCVQRNIRWAMIFCSGFMAIGTILRAALLQASLSNSRNNLMKILLRSTL